MTDIVSTEKKEEVWSHFSKIKPWPYGVTAKRLEKIKPVVFAWDFFWQDIVLRHGLLDQSPEQLKETEREVYNHCDGNFWGMVYEAMTKSGVIPRSKP